ncbi:MAG TPA: four helix bundle protein [Patescibacteria group bacterium]|nr:four helix bundle protein [Patescibacteria group bacterium]
MINKFETLDAWKESHKLVLMIYKEENYRLTDQICRSASSIAANLVEGSSRNTKKEYRQFAYQARASLEEAKYHLLLAKDLGYINESLYNKIMNQANITGKLINGLINYLGSRIQEQITK